MQFRLHAVALGDRARVAVTFPICVRVGFPIRFSFSFRLTVSVRHLDRVGFAFGHSV